MEQAKAWEIVVKTLRLHFLQGNSHIDGIEERIEEWVVETIDTIRKTPRSKQTQKIVSEIEGRELWAPRPLAH